ncbi:hypothetical protein M9H77_16380 [Catharanthus roseus]|uniref:Uncharacterized protein n=1 Tax=Catharanthus roseus TaxID=4058 RepID=A0ACC0B1L8_CATRO|nr:hypothetical protein M9H77_16380 [Catharanthus roseus]
MSIPSQNKGNRLKTRCHGEAVILPLPSSTSTISPSQSQFTEITQWTRKINTQLPNHRYDVSVSRVRTGQLLGLKDMPTVTYPSRSTSAIRECSTYSEEEDDLYVEGVFQFERTVEEKFFRVVKIATSILTLLHLILYSVLEEGHVK